VAATTMIINKGIAVKLGELIGVITTDVKRKCQRA
jgi:hypothetical protein